MPDERNEAGNCSVRYTVPMDCSIDFKRGLLACIESKTDEDYALQAFMK
jgi:hypothetical protein